MEQILNMRWILILGPVIALIGLVVAGIIGFDIDVLDLEGGSDLILFPLFGFLLVLFLSYLAFAYWWTGAKRKSSARRTRLVGLLGLLWVTFMAVGFGLCLMPATSPDIGASLFVNTNPANAQAAPTAGQLALFMVDQTLKSVCFDVLEVYNIQFGDWTHCTDTEHAQCWIFSTFLLVYRTLFSLTFLTFLLGAIQKRSSDTQSA